MLGNPEESGLLEKELVDDRELSELEADEFGHGDFVDELSALVMAAKTPTNIALFGPWGSGKSSIRQLLENSLPKKKSAVRFAWVDASKYAEAPLRRHFISQIADSLQIYDDKYHAGLHTSTEQPLLDINRKSICVLLKWFACILAGLTGVFAVLAAVAAAFSAAVADKNFGHQWSETTKDYFLAAVPFAAIVTTLLKIGIDGLQVKVTRPAPSGDDEFETHFGEIVKKANTERLVIFIDELDRSSPEQVASVLETLKTFLFAKGCVSIVAADQQVLEQALRRKARQHTPEDLSNPYYSAGSSYLDKVFQYQLALPPLRATSLSRYALQLVNDQPGVWKRLPSLDETISVLIPTHVSSPRRVKVLLNRFLMAYRLAERRASEGKLGDIESRATELAKLVCLQAEFPLFAEDLRLDARLPEFVLDIADNENVPNHIPHDIAQRAQAYAENRLPVAELLTGPARTRAPDDRVDTDEEEDDELRSDQVARNHGQQLISYLRKTHHVPGPGPDLVYLESVGAVHGFDALRAERIQRAASDNDVAQVLELLPRDDPRGTSGALKVLADHVRNAPGIESQNALSTLLRAIARTNIDLGDAADYIADAVAPEVADPTLERDDLLGALRLAAASSRGAAPGLLTSVVRHPDAAMLPDVAAGLVGRAADIDSMHDPVLAQAAATAVLLSPDQAIASLLALDEGVSERLLDLAKADLATMVTGHYQSYAAHNAGDEVDPEYTFDEQPHDTLGDIFDEFVLADRMQLVVHLARTMLRLKTGKIDGEIRERLVQLSPITDGPLTVEVIQAAQRDRPPTWPQWLQAVDRATVDQHEPAQRALDAMAGTVWTEYNADDDFDVEVRDRSVETLGVLARGLRLPELEATVLEALSASFAGEVSDGRQALALTKQFVEAGVLDRRVLDDGAVQSVIATLESWTPQQPGYRPAVPQPSVADVQSEMAARLDGNLGAASTDALERLLSVVNAIGWTATNVATYLKLQVAGTLEDRKVAFELPVTALSIAELVSGDPTERFVPESAGLWLQTASASGAEVWAVVEPLVKQPLPAIVKMGLRTAITRLDPDERLALLRTALSHQATHVDPSVLEAMEVRDLPVAAVADLLVEVFDVTTETAGVRSVLTGWRLLAPGQSTGKRLTHKIYLPLVRRGDEDLELALTYFDLVRNVKDVKTAVKDELKSAATSKRLKEAVARRLLDAEWERKSLFGLGPTVDKD